MLVGSLVNVTESTASALRISRVSKIGICPEGGVELGVLVNDAVLSPRDDATAALSIALGGRAIMIRK